MLDAVDGSQVTRHQELRLYKQGIYPRLSWPFLVTTTRLDGEGPATFGNQVSKEMVWPGTVGKYCHSCIFPPRREGLLCLH